MVHPLCRCGKKMTWISDNESWACWTTLDEFDVPRPKKGHDHFVDPADVLPNGDIKRGLSEIY